MLWTDADAALRADSEAFKRFGLYIWGAGAKPIYIGKTGSTFRKRFGRYIWGDRSQCNLANNFKDELIRKGVDGFTQEVRDWYARGYRGSTVRLKGAVRFATEGIDTVWFALFPTSDSAQVRSLEKVLIPTANEWNIRAGFGPLLNIESNRCS